MAYTIAHIHKHTCICTYTHANTRAHTHVGKMIVCQCSSWIDNDNNYADSLIEAL